VIALIDYGMGNLRSVEKALLRVGGDVRIVRDRNSALAADALVLPGVGAFGDCMQNLHKLELVDAIRQFISSGKPFLGICLGLQSLFDSSEEAAGVEGLKIFRGTVPRFHFNGSNPKLKVPHMGWNQLNILRPDCPLLRGISPVVRAPSRGDNDKTVNAASGDADSAAPHVYFVHSYYPKPADPSVVCATTTYGIEFCSMAWRDNIFATQFHPEKSQAVGLRMLENFVKLST
jgi:glutamine amidotransferase